MTSFFPDLNVWMALQARLTAPTVDTLYVSSVSLGKVFRPLSWRPSSKPCRLYSANPACQLSITVTG